MRTSRVLVFVDESNVVSSVRPLGRQLDWLKLRDHLASADRGRELIEMVIYAGLPFQLWYRDRTDVVKHWKPTRSFEASATLTNCKRLAIIIPIQVPRKK